MSETDSHWAPNEEYLNAIIEMGISEIVAREALFCTQNQSVDDAINFIFNTTPENGVLKQKSLEQAGDTEVGESCDEGNINYSKMVFVVNMSLKMGVGKIAAQVGHACLGLYRQLLEQGLEDNLNCWEEVGEKKIVLKGNDESHLIELLEKAAEEKIPAYLVKDAGHTQIAPGSVTVLSLFGHEEKVDKITGKLGLL
ncbi:probable peptidyl-tRNA hydrolase 2 [Cylas formicarius]|uniref:probable peptidyl-tRNA hydrolase 2 n=1 Tax=Cylas formicarius TaxID=197179 RepID=UPI0029584B0F|nr:probable peptidyl-tRNA hydrolase 2 [Cylas formicarius]